MNLFSVIIFAALLGEYALDLIADVVNLRHSGGEIPDEFTGLISPGEYRRSIAYTRSLTRFGMVTATVQLGMLLAFWFAGGFPWLDGIVRALGWHPVPAGCMYIGALMMLRALAMLPFAVYRTFIIEERFGFNRTTPVTFITDRIKGILLGVLIGGPLLAGVLAFFMYAGRFAWAYSWLAVAGAAAILQFIAPRWIMPLFNRFTPLEDGELRRRILQYARSEGYKLEDVYVIDGSRRSSKSNAFFAGFGKHKRIALFDTLIENHPVSELVAVLAHEIGHYRKRHVIEGMAITMLHLGVMLYLLSLVIGSTGLFQAFFMDTMSVHAGFVFFGFLYSPAETLLGIALQYRSRVNEYTADRFAAETTGQPGALADALKKLSVRNLSNLRPHPLYVALHYSHPPVLKRIAALRAMES